MWNKVYNRRQMFKAKFLSHYLFSVYLGIFIWESICVTSLLALPTAFIKGDQYIPSRMSFNSNISYPVFLSTVRFHVNILSLPHCSSMVFIKWLYTSFVSVTLTYCLYTHFLSSIHFAGSLKHFSTLRVNVQHKWKYLSQSLWDKLNLKWLQRVIILQMDLAWVFHKEKHILCCADSSGEVIIREWGCFQMRGSNLSRLDFVSEEFRQFLLRQPDKSFYQRILFPQLLTSQQPSSPPNTTREENNWQINRNHWSWTYWNCIFQLEGLDNAVQ